jgi:RNA polymerase-binding transcription factor
MAQLTQKQLKEIEKKLHDQQKALLEEVRSELDQRENQHLVELLRGEPGDTGDVSIADAVSDLNIANVDRHIHELRSIEAALARIKDGTYGRCVDCGCDIEPQRLLAYPTATRCLACQQRHEQNYAHEGHHSL